MCTEEDGKSGDALAAELELKVGQQDSSIY